MSELYRSQESTQIMRCMGRLGAVALKSIDANLDCETHIVPGPDGRRLAVEVSGSENGYPIFLLHGSPGSRLGPKPTSNTLRKIGVRLYAFDRPGYGRSDPNKGRKAVDTVRDMEALLEHFRIEGDYSAVGRSAGSEHVVACALALKGMKRAALLGGSAPPGVLGQERYEGLTDDNAVGFRLTEQQDTVALRRIVRRVWRMQQDEGVLPAILKQGFTASDRAAFSPLEAELVRTYREAVRQGPQGWIDDNTGLYDWGFPPQSLEEIRIPVLVWSGGSGDNLVTSREQQYLVDHIPTALSVVTPGASHFSACSDDIALPVFTWCVTGQSVP